MGLAILHAVPLDCRFTCGFLRQLLEQEPQLEDMEVSPPRLTSSTHPRPRFVFRILALILRHGCTCSGLT